jgi:hypothetical protein
MPRATEQQGQSMLVRHAGFDSKLPQLPGVQCNLNECRKGGPGPRRADLPVHNSILRKERRVHSSMVWWLGNILNCARRNQPVGHAFVRGFGGLPRGYALERDWRGTVLLLVVSHE